MIRTRLYLQNSPESIALHGWFYHDDNSGFYVAKPLEFVKVGDGICSPETFRIDRFCREDFCQCLIDELYRLGYRPTDATAGDKTDIKAHLEDMRKIAFRSLGDEEVKP
jgi:hypothetical protein